MSLFEFSFIRSGKPGLGTDREDNQCNREHNQGGYNQPRLGQPTSNNNKRKRKQKNKWINSNDTESNGDDNSAMVKGIKPKQINVISLNAVDLKPNLIVLDSGADAHATNNKKFLKNVRDCKIQSKVQL